MRLKNKKYYPPHELSRFAGVIHVFIHVAFIHIPAYKPALLVHSLRPNAITEALCFLGEGHCCETQASVCREV